MVETVVTVVTMETCDANSATEAVCLLFVATYFGANIVELVLSSTRYEIRREM